MFILQSQIKWKFLFRNHEAPIISNGIVSRNDFDLEKLNNKIIEMKANRQNQKFIQETNKKIGFEKNQKILKEYNKQRVKDDKYHNFEK